jgi:pilus assembly protein CpaB
MNRGTRTLIVLVVAVLSAAAASYGVYTAIRSIPERRVEIATRNAVVAKAQLAVGTLLTSDLVKVVPWPEKTPVQGGFADIAEVINRGLISGVVENEPITESKLAPKEAGAGMPPTITPGMRAISVQVNDVINVAGFVTAGTRVDVLTIIQRGNEEPTSRVVVSNVQVLTANSRYDQEEAKEGEAIRSTVVTLMVTPSDAERIALAQSRGQLMLTLRHPLDVEPTVTTGVTTAALFGGSPAPARPATPRRPSVAPPPLLPPPLVAVPRTYIVETIKAAKKSEDTLLKGD